MVLSVSTSGEFVFLLLRVTCLFFYFFTSNIPVIVSLAVFFLSLLFCFLCEHPGVVCALFSFCAAE